MDVEWDVQKELANLRKHGVGFEEADTSLQDPMARAREDPDATLERRWVLVGMGSAARLLAVVFTLRDEDTVRIISARVATKAEAMRYAQGI